jgi:WD40 repeat protein
VTSGALLHTLSGHSYDVYFITFSSDGKRLASASMDNAQVWNVSSGARLQQMQTMETHVGVFNFAQRTLINLVGVAVSRALTSDLHLLASSVNSKAIKLWDARSGAMLQTLEGHSDSVSDMAFSPDNKLLASASVDGTIRLWDAGS